jgi:hypothetical protein
LHTAPDFLSLKQRLLKLCCTAAMRKKHRMGGHRRHPNMKMRLDGEAAALVEIPGRSLLSFK